MIKAIYPGTFDPLTRGHEDLVRRFLKAYSEGVRRLHSDPEIARRAIVHVYNSTSTLQRRVVFGKDVKGEALPKVVKRLQGEDGTPVSMAVRQPGQKDVRTLDMIRGVIPFSSWSGYRRLGEDIAIVVESVDRWRAPLDTVSLHYAGKRVMIVAHQVVVLCMRYVLEHMRSQAFIRLGLMVDPLIADRVEDILPKLRAALRPRPPVGLRAGVRPRRGGAAGGAVLGLPRRAVRPHTQAARSSRCVHRRRSG